MNGQQQLTDYVRRQLAHGVAAQDIREVLIDNSWLPSQIDYAFTLAGAPLPMRQSPAVAPHIDSADVVGRGMFSRRINRRGFLLGVVYILVTLAAILIAFILTVWAQLQSSAMYNAIAIALMIACAVTILLIIPVLVSLYVRRLHDIGQSGLLTLLVLVPGANLFLFLYLLLKSGSIGVNQYGAPVKTLRYLVVLGFKKP